MIPEELPVLSSKIDPPFFGFIGHFRFRLVLNLARYIINQSELGIAQVQAKYPIRVFYFASWGSGLLLGNWGQNKKIKNLNKYLLIDLNVNRVPSELVVAVWLHFGFLLANYFLLANNITS